MRPPVTPAYRRGMEAPSMTDIEPNAPARIALVTGGASGIGRATAARFLA